MLFKIKLIFWLFLMLSFRKKIIATYCFIFVLLITLLVPFTDYFLKSIIYKAMEDRAIELIIKIEQAKTDEDLIKRLRDQKFLNFFRVSLITNEKKVLYDSHSKRLLGNTFDQGYIVNHPEVNEAFKKGLAFNDAYSNLLGQQFIYMAKLFDFEGKPYILRTAFPYTYIVEIEEDLKKGIIFLGATILFFFSLITWIVIDKLTDPIYKIIQIIKPFKDQPFVSIPKIELKKDYLTSEFYLLAGTLNGLSEKVKNHVMTLTHEKNEKEAILETLIEGVVAIDHNNKITYVNSMLLKMFNIKELDVVNQLIENLKEPVSQDLLLKCQEKNKVLSEVIVNQLDKNKKYLNLIAVPKEANKGAVLIVQDQTTHYKMMAMRKDFVANASHELKTPITIIRGFAETLHDNPDLSESITLDVIERIVRNCERMTHIIKDLLALADIDHLAASRLEQFDLIDLLNKCIETTKVIFPSAKIEIKNLVKYKIFIIADFSLLTLAFSNLLENAGKYSDKEPKISITLSSKGEFIEAIVADNGIGIPQEHLENIFQKFYTVNKRNSQKMGGSGLGLSIVETIIDKHFGKISVTSRLKEGTSFKLLFPKNLSKYIS